MLPVGNSEPAWSISRKRHDLLLLSWTDFKTCVNRGVSLLIGTDTGTEYIVYAMGRHETLCVKLDKNPTDTTERDDYVTNYKTGATTSMLAEYFNYRNIAGNATTTVKAGPGILQAILFNDNTTAGSVTVYDSATASGNKIATFQVGSPTGGLLSSTGFPGPAFPTALGIKFSAGLTVVTAGSSGNDITVIYR